MAVDVGVGVGVGLGVGLGVGVGVGGGLGGGRIPMGTEKKKKQNFAKSRALASKGDYRETIG